MIHAVAAVAALLWFAANFYLWSKNQTHPTLFLQSLGMGAVAFPALYWYVIRKP